MLSALPPKADIERHERHVRLVPKADSCTATNDIAAAGPAPSKIPSKLETLFVSAGLRCHRQVGVPEAGRYIDGRAIGQRYHRTDTRNRHQTPSHVIVPDDSQQAAMQDTDLFTEHPPDKEQWLKERSRMRLCQRQWLGRRRVGDHRRAMTVACYSEA